MRRYAQPFCSSVPALGVAYGGFMKTSIPSVAAEGRHLPRSLVISTQVAAQPFQRKHLTPPWPIFTPSRPKDSRRIFLRCAASSERLQKLKLYFKTVAQSQLRLFTAGHLKLSQDSPNWCLRVQQRLRLMRVPHKRKLLPEATPPVKMNIQFRYGGAWRSG
jgi:hypothetical protein